MNSYEQSDKLDVSDNQTGVPRCVVPLNTPGIDRMCMERCKPYICSVVDNIWHTTGQVWFSLVWSIDKYSYFKHEHRACMVPQNRQRSRVPVIKHVDPIG